MYNFSYDDKFNLLIMSLFVLICILSFVYIIIYFIGLYKFYRKCGRAGWECFVPIYNNWVLFEIAGEEGWYSLLPLVNVVYFYISLYKIFIKFGKSSGYAFAAIIFDGIFIPLIGFNDDVFQDDIETSNFNYQKDVKKEYRYCPHCGIKQYTKYCTKCGYKFE